MATGVNKVILIGHLGKDPESKSFSNGGSITNITLATSETWKDKEGNRKEATEWHNVVFHNQLGEIVAKYLNKGSKIYVEGKLKTRKWEKDGVTRYTTEIHANEMQMLDSAPSSSRSENPAPARRSAPAMSGHEDGGGFRDDDIPFAPRSWKEG